VLNTSGWETLNYAMRFIYQNFVGKSFVEVSPLGLILSREPSGSVGTGVWPRTRTFGWRQSVVGVFRTVGQATPTYTTTSHTPIFTTVSPQEE